MNTHLAINRSSKGIASENARKHTSKLSQKTDGAHSSEPPINHPGLFALFFLPLPEVPFSIRRTLAFILFPLRELEPFWIVRTDLKQLRYTPGRAWNFLVDNRVLS